MSWMDDPLGIFKQMHHICMVCLPLTWIQINHKVTGVGCRGKIIIRKN